MAKGAALAAEKELTAQHDLRPNLSDAGLVHAHLGRKEEALRDLGEIKALSLAGFGVGYEMAVVSAALGDAPAACAALRLALRDHSPFMGWMKLDPRMDPMRGQACFKDVERSLYRE